MEMLKMNKPNPEKEPKNTKDRNRLAGRLKIVRQIPFEQSGVRNFSPAQAKNTGTIRTSIGSSSLEMREVQMDVDFIREIKEILKRKKEQGKNEPARILDVGSALSTFLLQLKRKFAERLEAHSLDVRFFDPNKFFEKKGTLQHIFHVEGMSRVLPHDYFDIIVDCRGGVLYARDREKALQEIYALLAPGAHAYVFPKPFRNLRNIFNGKWIQDWADQNGAKVEFHIPSKTHKGTTVVINKPGIIEN